jgi:hypothetical protein
MYVIIPAAGDTRGADGSRNSDSPLLRVSSGKAFFELLIEQLQATQLDIEEVRVGIKSKDEEQLHFIASKFKLGKILKLIDCDQSEEAGETIDLLLDGIPMGEKVLLNLGDTVAQLDWTVINQTDFGLACTRAPDSFDRLSVVRESQGRLSENGDADGAQVGLIGIYWFTHSPEIKFMGTGSALESALRRFGSDCVVLEADSWTDADFSHRFVRLSSPKFDSRSFNEVKRFADNQLIIKKSKNREKLEREFRYITELPIEKASFFPAQRAFTEDGDVASIIMDYWPFENLSDIYCLRKYPAEFWMELMAKLESALKIIHEPLEPDNAEFEFAFISKTKQRLIEMQQIDYLAEIVSQSDIVVNSTKLPSPFEIVERAQYFFSTGQSHRSVVHGDFCFSNILVEPNTLTIKFVDPRGGFLEPGIYGPTEYDRAKLAHSIIGAYDLILKGFYSLKSAGRRNFTLEINYPPHHMDAEGAFRSKLVADQDDWDKLRLQSGLILMSIPPLHIEDESRATAFLIKGMLDAFTSLSRLG